MKKFFTFCAAVFCACTMFAVEVTFDFATEAGLTAMGITKAAASAGTNISTITYNGVVFTADKGSAGTNPRVWTGTSGATDFRIYSGSTLKIAGADSTDVITKIEMSGSKLNFTELTNGQWTGSANSVTFTPTATSNVNVIIVTMNEEAVVYVPDTISVSDAKALIDANDPKMNKGHYVKGVVAGDPFALNGIGPAFYMTDINIPTDSLEGFKIAKDANNTAFANLAEMEALLGAGDTIMIYANGLALYNNKIYETTSGYFVEMLGKSNAIILNWSNEKGSAFREDGTWELEIKKVASSNNDKLNLIFSSDKENAIAGFHALNEGSSMKLDGANLPIASGSVQLSFKSVNDNGYNVYEMKVVLVANDQMYRLNQDIEFFASKDGDEIVLVGDRPFKPTVDGQEITCAQAKEYALTLADNETSELNVSVTGFITDLFTDGQSFWMDDKQGSNKVLQAYKFKTLTPTGVSLKKGAKVKVVGKVTNYGGTAEIKNGAVEILEGGEEIPMIKVNVAEALAAGMALDSGATSTDFYEITGFITEVIEPYGEYKNITFWMGDAADDAARQFQAYHISCDASIADKLIAGAHVVVTAYIQNYYKAATDSTEEKHVIEAVKGSVVLYGTGVENVWDTNNSSVKIFRNGQIYIRRNAGLYNLQGIKVD